MKNTFNKPISTLCCLLLFILVTFSNVGCSDLEVTGTTIPNDWINISTQTRSFTHEGGLENINFTLASGLDASKISISFSDKGEDWCTATIKDSKLMILIEHSYGAEPRSTGLTLLYDENHKCTIPIEQAPTPSIEDKIIKVVGGIATSEETSGKDTGGNPLTLAMSYDGNKSTYFNSKFGAVTYPFNITYELEEGHTLNRIVYTPRTDSGNKWGSFDKFSVEVATADKPDNFTRVGTYERGDGVHSSFAMRLPEGVNDIKKVRFVITKAYQDRVSCAEMEFFEENKNKFNPSSIFTDAMFTQLKSGVTEKQIRQIPDEYLKQLGLALLNGKYDSAYRLANYRPYQNPSIMATANKTAKYSLRDNPTGIYAGAGETLAVIVGPIYKGGKISMLIQDLNGGYNNSKTYALEEGYNQVKVEVGGLIYILNHVSDDIPLLPETDAAKKIITDKTVQIHFPMGKVNGYFDIQKNSEADWAKMRDNAPYQDIDVLGKYAHITWRVSDFKKYNTEITKTIDNYDRLVLLQEEFMGLVKYKKMFNNRMHFSIDYVAKSPNATDYRTVYNASDYYAEPFCKPERFAARCWGPAHEVGHCNQTRPGLKWAGLTEVTNNIMSLWIQTSFGESCKLLVDGNNNGKYANFYEWSADYIISQKRAHCLPEVESITRELQLVPFWQLKLYMIDALGKKDFYHDLYEHYRITPNLDSSKTTEGIVQLDFVRQVCALAQLNMLDFFEKWGFLTPVNTILNDYSDKAFIITQQQVDALKQEINGKGYPMPHANVHQITDANINNYK